MPRRFNRLAHKGRIVSGKLELENPKWFRGMIALSDDCEVTVLVERKKKSRSDEQLGYYWGVVLVEISRHTGHTPEELHEIFKAKYLKGKAHWRGFDIATVGTTSALSTNEMAEFVTNVIVEAEEMEIEIPPPDQLYQFK